MAPIPITQLFEAANAPPVLSPESIAALIAKAREGDTITRLVVEQFHRDANTIYMLIETLRKHDTELEQLRAECARLRAIATDLADFIEASHANADEQVPDALVMQMAAITEAQPCSS